MSSRQLFAQVGQIPQSRRPGLPSSALAFPSASSTLFSRRLSSSPPSFLTYPASQYGSTLAAGGLVGRAHRTSLRAGLLDSNVFRSLGVGQSAVHNLSMTRQISFARVIPKLVSKFATVGAVGGGAVVAGVSYIQYQATQAGNFVVDIFSSVRDTTVDVAGGIADTFDKVTSSIEIPAWLRDGFSDLSSMAGSGGGSDSSGGHENGSPEGPSPNTQQNAAFGAAAGATAIGLSNDEESPRDDHMMLLTKKMIQIRRLLQSVDHTNAFTLPSIVVIGSQSSGKSSVLESIVGHEFLPKGSNMVTRRPIELTLVNTPHSTAEYAEFPTLGMSKVTDFSHVQRTLTDLNLSVSPEECVSDDPIQLRIYSPNVPDLSLIDLPGYIQVTGRDQPPELKAKIAQLCDKYIKEPNVILAISAADVDLANSTALRASRLVDPRGERTIGVITKMDLVDPERGSDLLNDQKYALRLGYVGVVSRVPPSPAVNLFNRGNQNISAAVQKNEEAFFGAHPAVFGPRANVDVGTKTLRSKLISVLEQTMAASLKSVSVAVQQELAEATYEFKVQYNERPISAETYLAESLDAFKHSFRSFADSFGRGQVRSLIMDVLDQQVLDLLAHRYWNAPIEGLGPEEPETDSLKDLPKANPDDPLWHLKLDSSVSSLTKLGIGRLATSTVASALQSHIDSLVESSSFSAHPSAKKKISEASAAILRDLSYDISEEVEICVKPYKYRIDLEDSEWARARESVGKVLKEELKVCQSAIQKVEEDVGGRRRLRDVLGYIQRVRSGQVVLENNGVGGAGGFSASLLKKGQDAAFLQDRIDLIQMRLLAIKAKQCANKVNKYYCPEVFLNAVADKLTTTADLFIDAELLSKFYHSFPRELDSRLGKNLSPADTDRFAREDPRVRRHLDLVRRKDLLEQVLREIDDLRRMEARSKRRAARLKGRTDGNGGGNGKAGDGTAAKPGRDGGFDDHHLRDHRLNGYGAASGIGNLSDDEDDYDDMSRRRGKGWRLF